MAEDEIKAAIASYKRKSKNASEILSGFDDKWHEARNTIIYPMLQKIQEILRAEEFDCEITDPFGHSWRLSFWPGKTKDIEVQKWPSISFKIQKPPHIIIERNIGNSTTSTPYLINEITSQRVEDDVTNFIKDTLKKDAPDWI
jgi:hypothetical protein